MARERPINADVPAGEEGGDGAAKQPSPPEPAPKTTKKKPRRSVPLPLRLVAAAILIAAVFIVAAILGGGGESGFQGPAPSVGGAPSAGETAPSPSSPEPVPQEEAPRAAPDLGYPGFATKNTTRVGGNDSASVAAGAALAVFPSTSAAQRPAAVVLVGEDDWAGGIAASVLMASPVRAPILVSGARELPAASIEALAALDPQGSAATHGTAIFAVDGAAAPGGSDPVEVGGKGPAAAAAAIAELRDRLFGGSPLHFVIAPAAKPAFAMPAAAWAARSGDPVLFSAPDGLPAPTAAALRAHPHVPAFVLGPSSAISSKVIREIAKITRVRRVAGKSPVDSAIAFARYSAGGFGWDVNDPGHGFVVARSDRPLDAAAAAPLSASGTWGPLLLSDDGGSLPAALRAYFLDVKPGYTEDPTRAFYNHVWVIGDQEAISVAEQAEIDSLAELAKIGAEP